MNIKNNQLPVTCPSQRVEMFAEVTQHNVLQHPIPTGLKDNKGLLSFAQQRFWFLDQLLGPSTAYHVSIALQLNGQLNITLVEKSIQELVQRHEILRTTFVAGKPIAVTHPSAIGALTVFDLQAFQQAAKERERLIQAAITRPFDLAQGPLMRTTLLQLAPQEHIFLMTLPQIIADTESMDVLIREWATLYQAFYQQKPAPLPPLPIQYADFAVWQRQWLSDDLLAPQRLYWQQQLTGVPPLLTLPTDHPRPPLCAVQGRSCALQFDSALTQSLNSLSQDHQVTLFMTLLSAFACVLARYSGQTDIVIGTPISTRIHPQTESLIGSFVNILALRLILTANPSFTQLLKQAEQITLDAYAHQALPFEQVVETLKIERNLTHSPLFQVMLIVNNRPALSLTLPELTAKPLAVKSFSAQYDLTLSLTETEQGLEGILEYNADLFKSTTIERFIGHFHTLLTAIIADPEQPVAQLPILTATERQQLLVEWNDTTVDYPQACIHQLFEAQVEQTPETIAVVFADQQLSYQQLNAKANQLAHHLKTLGVQPEVLVGLCVERSLEMVIGLLGILKAGGAYVPLDPRYPQERLAFMLADANVTVLLTQQAIRAQLPEHHAQVICLDSDWEQIAQHHSENLAAQVDSKHLAYVMYTSGSTGKPKGTLIVHQGLSNYLLWCTQAYQVAQDKGAMVHASMGFDATITSLFSPLLVGQRIHLIAEDQPEIEVLSTLLTAQNQWSLVKITPAHLSVLNAELSEETLNRQKYSLILGGEALTAHSLLPWRRYAPNVNIINEYGPTETVVGCCVYAVSEQTPLEGAIPIGRPIANTQLYILDAYLQPVPIGVAGELYIGGAGLARGYLNRPELTAEKFIPHPFSDDPQARLYKTGDLTRYLPDGNIEYLGRIDNQVKIRGFRIELGEIEALLEQHAQIKATAVIVHERAVHDKRLIAYIVPANVAASELRAFLKHSLPEYMIPSAFIALDALPLTPNGKVDRQALQKRAFQVEHNTLTPPRTRLEHQLAHIWTTVLNGAQVSIDDNFFAIGGHSLLSLEIVSQAHQAGLSLTLQQLFQHQTIAELALAISNVQDTGHQQELHRQNPTQTETESQLAALWCSVLGIHQVNLNDNFYDLGGHSLLATQLISRIRATFHKEISLGTLFERPTLAQLAQCLAAAQPITSIQVQSTPVSTHYPLAGNQYPYWLFEQLYPHTATYNEALVFKLVGHLNMTALEQAVNELIQHHIALRTTIDTNDTGQLQQQIQPVQKLTITPTLLTQSSDDVLIQEEIRRPFDLTQEYLIRVKLVRVSEHQHTLIFTFHHIIMDGWSIGLFIEAFSQYYTAKVTPQAAPLLPPNVHYRDFCFWQTQWLQTEEAREQQAYWQQQLQGPLPILHLPVAQPRPAIPTYEGQRHPFTIATPVTTALYRLSQQHGVTLFMTVLTAFKTLLYRYSGQTDLLVGTSIAGRRQLQWEQTLGLFMNNLVLRTQVCGSISFLSLLEQVRQVALEAYQHQDLPFQMVVDSLPRERQLNQATLFQVFFLLQNFDLPALKLPGLTTTSIATGTGQAKFDLTLELYEHEQQLSGWFEYNTTLFTAETIQRLEQHFQTLLEAIVTTPENTLSSLPLLTAQERQHLKHWHPQAIFKPEALAQSLAARFEQQVALYPQKIAVKTRNYEWDYLTLNAKANQVARRLLALPHQTSQQIALLFEHDAPMLVGLLAVLKAGLAYVPLTPDLPTQRLQQIIEDAQVSGLLTTQSQGSLAQRLTADKLPIINIDTPLTEASDNLNLPIAADSLAYLLYTSGSTGQPKGVIQNQRNVLHFIRTYTNQLAITAADKLTLFSAYSFDAAVMDIFAALLNGATLYPIDLKQDDDPIAWLTQQAITIFHATPTVYRHLMGLLNPEDKLMTIRWLVLGGEAVYQSDFELYQRYFAQHCTFVNGLGPTESTVTLHYHLTHTTSTRRYAIPVGYPVAETEIVLLDERGAPTEFYGEIGIKSEYLALGYWQRPELTQAAFLPATANKRLYRSGDMGFMGADGSLEFIGRKDAQVKVRGFRIELGEIETDLKQHPSVAETIVMIHEDKQGLKHIVAYIVPKLKQHALTTPQWRHFLEDKLPAYMIPAFFITLNALPLTPNGKLDQNALYTIPALEQVAQNHYVLPRDIIELQLTQLWEHILATRPIGIDDNFFDLGGHSLLAVTLLNAIQRVFNKNIPLLLLFQAPTIAQLADILRKQQHTVTWHTLEVIQPHGENPPFFFICPTHYARALARALGTEQPIYKLNLLGLQHLHKKIDALETVAQQYIREMQTIQPQGPYYIGGFCGQAKVALALAAQLQAQGHQVAFLTLLQALPYHVQFRFYHHWQKLLNLGPNYLFLKIYQKIKLFIRQSKRSLLKKYNKQVAAAPIKTKKSVQELEYTVFVNSFFDTLAHYTPPSYPGDIVLFHQSEWCERNQLALELTQAVAAGKIEVYPIPATEEDKLFVPPRVNILAEQLKNCLAKAKKSAECAQ